MTNNFDDQAKNAIKVYLVTFGTLFAFLLLYAIITTIIHTMQDIKSEKIRKIGAEVVDLCYGETLVKYRETINNEANKEAEELLAQLKKQSFKESVIRNINLNEILEKYKIDFTKDDMRSSTFDLSMNIIDFEFALKFLEQYREILSKEFKCISPDQTTYINKCNLATTELNNIKYLTEYYSKQLKNYKEKWIDNCMEDKYLKIQIVGHLKKPGLTLKDIGFDNLTNKNLSDSKKSLNPQNMQFINSVQKEPPPPSYESLFFQ